MTDKQVMTQILEEAVNRAINQVGLERFKSTSMFMSSRRPVCDKAAA